MVRVCLEENEGMGLLKPERKTFHIEKGICGQVGERAVEVGKMESNRTWLQNSKTEKKYKVELQ